MMTGRQRFLAALRGDEMDRPSLGTITSLATTEAMEACGAAFPRAHLDARAMAELAAFVSLEAGFDMIFPLFSVVHEAAALGAEIDWGARDVMPSIIRPRWREPEECAIPADFEAREGMAVPLAALRRLKAAHGESHAMIGKVFGPWTLGYHMYGVQEMLLLTLDDPAKAHRIFTALLEVTIRSAEAQFAAGADILCLADHCSRDMVSAETYRVFLQPLHRVLARRFPGRLALHTCGDTADRISLFAETGLCCFHFDTRVPAARAAALAGGRMTLMGGVSNIAGLLQGDEARIAADVRAALAAGVRIIGPECAIPLNTRMRSLRLIGDALKAAEAP